VVVAASGSPAGLALSSWACRLLAPLC